MIGADVDDEVQKAVHCEERTSQKDAERYQIVVHLTAKFEALIITNICSICRFQK
jgi:hypothetical protein